MTITEPWMHILYANIGFYVGYKYPLWERALLTDINERRASRGLPPFIPTNSTWMGLKPSE